MELPLSDWKELSDALHKLQQELAYFEGLTLVGINFRFRDDDVLLVVKARRGEEALVCFTSAVTAIDALDLFYGHIHSRSYPQVSWKADKYAR
mgnify:CR=1 FL=1